jgi:large subunit ribosomal protein L32
MAHPKKRLSPPRQGNRRRNIFLELPVTTTCPECKAVIPAHTACPQCGKYRGRAVVTV